MSTVKKLAKYYKQCLYEEAKVSAFSNLNTNDNVIVQLSNSAICAFEYPNLIAVAEDSAELTNLSIKAKLDKKKQLLYGYMFIQGTLLDNTEIYTPLFYADCTLERVNGNMSVGINNETLSLNLPALIQLVPNNEDKDMLVQQLINYKLTLPLTNETVNSVIQVLKDTVNILGSMVKLEEKEAVILTTINKGLAGVINELNTIEQKSAIDDNNSLRAITPFVPKLDDLDMFVPAVKLDSSQIKVAKVASQDIITAITGGPGTGKSTTIAGIATNYILNGKTVLICSKQNSAVDVLYNKISKMCSKPCCIRTGGKEYRATLAKTINDVLSSPQLSSYNIERAYTDMKNLTFNYDLIEKHTTLRRLSSEQSTRFHKYCNDAEQESNIFKKLFKYIGMLGEGRKLNRLIEDEIQARKACGTHVEDYAFLRQLAEEAFSSYICGKLAKAKNNPNIRRLLMTYAKALVKGGAEQLESSYETIFKVLVEDVFPCWCTTTVDVSISIPLVSGLFDVVIIDEASQCDIATCLPLLYRAKRAVIVGDDKQLKYLSFIPIAVNNANVKSAGLSPEDVLTCNYRDNSMFDFARFYANGDMILEQQYRGCPEMMNFSNKTFYNGNITNVCKKEVEVPIYFEYLNNAKISKGKTVNQVEIDAIMSYVEDIIKHDSDNGVTRTIGILSPFRDQCKAIEKELYNRFTTQDIEKHNMLVGTAHSFQGEERDVMLLSWTVADNSHVQQFSFINNPNLFNVAITRANKQIINFLSTKNLPKGLLKEYVDYYNTLSVN